MKRMRWGHALVAMVVLVVGLAEATHAVEESILPGEYKTGDIAGAGWSDSYYFAASAGDAVTVLMGVIEGSLDPEIKLYGPNGYVVGSWGYFSATIEAQKVDQDGTYLIVCRDHGGTGTGTYGVSLIKNPGPNVTDPDGGPIQPGETKTGTIEAGDLDAFDFAASAGDVVAVLMGVSGGQLDPQVELHGPDGSVVASQWGYFSATIEAQVDQDGTYLIVCRDHGGTGTGTYGVSLQCLFASYRPDLWIGGDGNDIYNTDGTYQTEAQTVDLGVTATYPLKVENDGIESDSYTLTGTAGGSGWTVRYYDALSGGTEITSEVTGTGWTVGPLAPGEYREFRVEVTPDSTVPNGTVKDVLVTATSAGNGVMRDTVKASTMATSALYQPDLWVQQGAIWLGDDIYNDDGTGQTATQTVATGTKVLYRARLYNDGAEAETFWIKGPVGSDNWTVRYYRGSTADPQREVTDLVTSPSGWKRPNLAPGLSVNFCFTVTSAPSLVRSFEVPITARSHRDAQQSDTIKAVTRIPDVQPDLWIYHGGTWLGDDIYNEDGTDQSGKRRVRAGVTATYVARLYNDGEETETFYVKGPGSDGDWTVQYFQGATEVTDQVTSSQGWPVTLTPGNIRSFKILVTPRSGLAVGQRRIFLVRAESQRDPTQRDAIQTFTQVK